ncbi:MAG: glycosyltransferase family 39 protein, partial [Holophagales bacterium]|nr:glycosyltransferase family 39 protein [Holophagales bacterium]
MPPDASPKVPISEKATVDLSLALGLVLVLALAAWIRLEGSDTLDTRGDEVELVLMIQDGKQPLPYLVEHFRDFGYSRQLPLPRVLTTAFVRWSGFEATAGHVRLPFAWAGVLAVAAMFWLGLEIAGRRLAWVSALLAATHPFSVYWSKTAHIYAFPLLFVAATLAAMVRLTKQVDATGRAGW